ncbi:hypothetical protein TCAL_12376 [Tigriopus californicus]|uniref:Major facilitator superfamily (MFS) profile domain-containing protein n=1 Tax=Tigriopus californicus TaxID=6832 RepID=A0A553NAR5_TIGCA|nr:MFS-type transporter SLC18B1-like [Tigriopus californicus]TRY62520.1 hypothetical protein TCAL_12376 [Tigriopus californicus]
MVCSMLRNFSRRQWLTVIVFSIVQFCQAICVSLQAPFYPQEAEKKGATPTQYGLVFGVFELTVFIVSPYIGQNINRMGGKRVFNTGIFTTGFCSILFGLLDKIQDGTWFIALSFVIRIIEAVGNSMFLCAAFTITAKEFPENVATMFACMETFFGVGLIVGPSVGGALYELGGYYLPFVSLGSCLVLAACLTLFLLPSNYDEDDKNEEGPRKGMIAALQVPSISIAVLSVLCASSSVGFLLTTLEPHMRQFQLTPVSMGLMFVVNGGCYAMTAPCFGVICDKWAHPTIVNYFGLTSVIASFTLLGPAPFFPIPTYISVCIVALILHGCALGATLVSGFSIAHKEAVRHGFPTTLTLTESSPGCGRRCSLWAPSSAVGGGRHVPAFGHALGVPIHRGIRDLGAPHYHRFQLAEGTLEKSRRSEYEPIVTDDQLGPDYGSRRMGRSPSIGYSSGSGQSSSNPSPPLVGVDPEQAARSLPHTESSSSLAMRGTSQRRRSRSASDVTQEPIPKWVHGPPRWVLGYAVSDSSRIGRRWSAP